MGKYLNRYFTIEDYGWQISTSEDAQYSQSIKIEKLKPKYDKSTNTLEH